MQRRCPRSALKSALLLGTPLLLSACAYTHGITPQEQAVSDQVAVGQFMPATRDMRDNIETQELFAQAAFWSHEYDLNPSDLEATIKLAASVRKLGNPSRAVEITQTSRQIHPRDPYLLAEHAAGLIADQRSMDALPVLEQGLRLAPAYGRLWSLRGAALDQMENYAAARESYGRALQITPNDPNVLTNLGLSYALAGDLTNAETWLGRAVNLPGAGPSARENLALVLQLQGRTEEAERQARLAGMSQGDQRFPPPPVPALTPRGAPAQLNTNPSLQNQRSTQQQPINPTWSGRNAGMPATRLTTTDPNGQAFTSSSQAARRTAAPSSLGQYESARAPQGYQSGYPQTYQQGSQQVAPMQGRDILGSIRQSLQPGAVTPQGQYTPQGQAAPQGQLAPAGPQPYIVGQGSAQTSMQVPTQTQTQPFISSPTTGPQTGYPQYMPQAEPTRRDPARRRR